MAAEQKVNTQFVLEVEKYPCLYNYSLPEYVRKDVVDKAWIEIGRKFNLSGAECKEKWRNLRNVFVRNLKSGKREDGRKKKKPYYLNDVMQFTLPFVKLSNVPVSGNLPTPTVTNEILNNETSDEEDNTLLFEEHAPKSQLQASTDSIGSQSILQNILQDQSQNEQIRPQFAYVPTPSPSPQSSSVRSPPEPTPSLLSPLLLPPPSPTEISSTCNKKKGRKTKTSADEEILEYFKTKQARKETNQPLEQQPKKMFLLSLLPDLESMSDQQTRTFKKRVLQLIEDILEENKPSPSSAENNTLSFYLSVADQINTENKENENV